MATATAIAAIVSAAIGAGTAVYGGVKSSQAEKEQQRIADEQHQLAKRRDDELRHELKKGYLETPEGSALMGKARDDLKEQADRAEASAAMTGATHQAKTAARQGAQKQYANAVRGIAAHANAYRNNLMAWQNSSHNQLMGLSSQQQAAYGQQAQGAQNLMASGLNTLGASASLYAGGGKATPAQQKATPAAKTFVDSPIPDVDAPFNATKVKNPGGLKINNGGSDFG